jgi:hypothetical protein
VDPGPPVNRPQELLARPASDAAQARLARSAVVACACSVAWAAVAGVASVAAGESPAVAAEFALRVASLRERDFGRAWNYF